MEKERLKPRAGSVGNVPVIPLVNSIISTAIRRKSSGVHLEPFEEEFLVRNRVDGVLQNAASLPRALHGPVISRIREMANLGGSEGMTPQDGRIKVTSEGREVDISVSILPTSFGERAVLRIVDKTSIFTEAARFFRRVFVDELHHGAGEPTPVSEGHGVEDGERILATLSGKGLVHSHPAGSEFTRHGVIEDFFSRYLAPKEPDQQVTAPLKEMLGRWDCQEVPLTLFEFSRFREQYGSKGVLEVLIGIEEEKVRYPLPKISSVSTGYMIGGKLPRVDFDVVAFGFRNREYTEEALVIWAVDFFSGKVLDRGKLEHFENRCRLLSLEKSLSEGQLVKWVLFDGKVDDGALAYASSCGIFTSHVKQQKILFNLFGLEEGITGDRGEKAIDVDEGSRDLAAFVGEG